MIRQTLNTHFFYILVSVYQTREEGQWLYTRMSFFLNNLLIDGAVLMTTAWTRRVRAAWWRIGAAALIGASYVAMMFLPETKFLFFTFAVKCIFSIVMIMTAFGFGSLQHFLRNMGAFYVVNFAAAGGIFGAHYFFSVGG